MSEDTCCICFEVYDSATRHDPVSLTCGHPAGRRCFEKWIAQPSAGNRPSCPTCRKIGSLLRPWEDRIVKSLSQGDVKSSVQPLIPRKSMSSPKRKFSRVEAAREERRKESKQSKISDFFKLRTSAKTASCEVVDLTID